MDNIDVSSYSYLIVCVYSNWNAGGSSSIDILEDGVLLERAINNNEGTRAGKLYDVSAVNTFTFNFHCSGLGGPSSAGVNGIYLF